MTKSDGIVDLRTMSADALLDALPHVVEGSKPAFVAALVGSIATGLLGPVAGSTARAAVKRALEGGFESHATKIFREAHVEIDREQKLGKTVNEVADALSRRLSVEVADAIRVSLNESELDLRTQLGRNGADILDGIHRVLSQLETGNSSLDSRLVDAYGVLDAKFEAYVLAAKNLRDRFEYEGPLLLDGAPGAEEALSAAILRYNATYDDLRINRFSDLRAVLRHASRRHDLGLQIREVYATMLDDVHRRGIYGLNGTRIAMLELETVPAQSVDWFRARRQVDRSLRTALKEINERLEVLDSKLAILRERLR